MINTIAHNQQISSRIRHIISKANTIKLVVCDMHGTIMTDNGMAKQCFRKALRDFNIEWGLKKTTNMIDLNNKINEFKDDINEKFELYMYENYYNRSHELKLIDDGIPEYLEELRSKDIKVAFNTEYCSTIQAFVMDVLNLNEMVDGYISSSDVQRGRPAPDMINSLMSDLNVDDPRQVCKIGDTIMDVTEGKRAKAGMIVSVLSGDGDVQELTNKGQHMILDNIISLRLV